MREGIGSIALYNIIIIFIAVTFSILAGTMSYSKAFKANNRIINAIEKFEGYNEASAKSIDLFLSSIGYKYDTHQTCKKQQGITAMQDLNPNFNFCVYQFIEETKQWNGRFATYGVKTFINIDLPIIGEFVKIPVYARSKMIFNFSGNNKPNQQITASLSVHVANNEIAQAHLVNGKLTFKLGEIINVQDCLTVFVTYSDNTGYEVFEYEIDNFSTQNVGTDLSMNIRYGEMSSSILYDVIN